MISVVISVFVIASIAMLTIMTAQNFVATSNYVQMNDQSRYALDRISREIRNASSVVNYSSSNPQFLVLTNDLTGTSSTITCDTSAGTLILSRSGQSDQTLLTGCDTFGFQFLNRVPLVSGNNLTFYTATNPSTDCKVIDLNWKCSRTILGSKLNTEVVQTAQVMLRNK